MFNSDPPRLFGQPTSQPTVAKVKVPRSGYRGTTSHLSNANDPDPNGDVTLVVSPPTHPPQYKQETSLFGTNVKSSLLFSTSPSATSIGSTVSSTPAESGPPKSRFRVSSKQLMLASAYFEKMLTPRWREGQALRADGSIEVNIPDTDPYTFLIILDIIHCRRARVPRVVGFDNLTELAVLTDYFQFHEALEPYPSIWLELLKAKIPSVHSNTIIKWIFVSWVFNYDAIFTKVTKIAQRQASHDIYLVGLPIPESIYGAIDHARKTALASIFTALKLRREYLEANNQPTCCDYCDSLYLGALIRLMKSNNLNLENPYVGLSVEAAAERVSGFRQPRNIHPAEPFSTYNRIPETNSKLLGESTKQEVEKAVSVLQGLHLS